MFAGQSVKLPIITSISFKGFGNNTLLVSAMRLAEAPIESESEGMPIPRSRNLDGFNLRARAREK
jgi:hypothetical protein